MIKAGNLKRLFDRAVTQSELRFFISIFLPITVVYAVTASWDFPPDFDALTNTVSAWHIANTGSVRLPGYEPLTRPPYAGLMGAFTEVEGSAVSSCPPGTAFLAALAYAVAPGELSTVHLGNAGRPELASIAVPFPPTWPATLVAVLTSAIAVSCLGLTFLRQADPREAWAATWVAGLGTSAWSVASSTLYMHGPAMMWIALGVYWSSRQGYWKSGLAFGAAVVTRPHTAVIPAALGLGLGASDRNLRPIVRIGLASFLGVIVLVTFNHLVFDKTSAVAGYGEAFAERLATSDLGYLFHNILGGLFDPTQGFLLLSPFLLLLTPGLITAWRKSEPWVRSAAIGGLIYLILQFKMNRYDPANATLYRYPLEALTASAPLWFAAYLYWLKRMQGSWRRLFPKAILFAITTQLLVLLLA